MNDCIFCKIVKGEIPSRKVYEDADTLAFEDIAPQAKTHILVIPKRHYADILDISRHGVQDLAAMMHAVEQVVKAKGLEENGFRLV
jgi:histidine triad (HIT) family protein